jgi:hypothetical protein
MAHKPVTVGRSYRHLAHKVHVVAITDDGDKKIVVFKHWAKGRWNYHAEELWLFEYVIAFAGGES